MEKVILISIDGCRADALAPSPHFTVGAFCREKIFPFYAKSRPTQALYSWKGGEDTAHKRQSRSGAGGGAVRRQRAASGLCVSEKPL